MIGPVPPSLSCMSDMINRLCLQKCIMLSNMPFVHTSNHNFKTTGYVWVFCIFNNCFAIEDIYCVAYSCMRYAKGELRLHTCIVVILWHIIGHALQAHTYIVIWYTSTNDNITPVVYDCTTTHMTALQPMMHRFVRPDLATYSIDVAVTFQ